MRFQSLQIFFIYWNFTMFLLGQPKNPEQSTKKSYRKVYSNPFLLKKKQKNKQNLLIHGPKKWLIYDPIKMLRLSKKKNDAISILTFNEHST